MVDHSKKATMARHPSSGLGMTCAVCREGDSETRGRVLIFPSGNAHRGCKAEGMTVSQSRDIYLKEGRTNEEA